MKVMIPTMKDFYPTMREMTPAMKNVAVTMREEAATLRALVTLMPMQIPTWTAAVSGVGALTKGVEHVVAHWGA
jgi:hypothetical protein